MNASEGWREGCSRLVSEKHVGAGWRIFKSKSALRLTLRSEMIPAMLRSVARLLLALAIAIHATGAAWSAGTTTATSGEAGACSTVTQLLDQAQCWWATYVDPYFGATIDYPADLLNLEPSYAEGAGRRFASSDGAMVLSVWGATATGSLSVTEAMATDLYRSGFETVTNQMADVEGYTIGGRHGAREFLKRVRWSEPNGKVVETACITWPTDRDSEFRLLAEKIVATLRDGRGWARNPRARISDEMLPQGSCRGL